MNIEPLLLTEIGRDIQVEILLNAKLVSEYGVCSTEEELVLSSPFLVTIWLYSIRQCLAPEDLKENSLCCSPCPIMVCFVFLFIF